MTHNIVCLCLLKDEYASEDQVNIYYTNDAVSFYLNNSKTNPFFMDINFSLKPRKNWRYTLAYWRLNICGPTNSSRDRNAMRMNENVIVICTLLIMLVVGGFFIHGSYMEISERSQTDRRREVRSTTDIRGEEMITGWAHSKCILRLYYFKYVS